MAKFDNQHKNQAKVLTALVLSLCSFFSFAEDATTAPEVAALQEIGTVQQPLGSTYKKPSQLQAGTGRITFYRLDAGHEGVANLRINSHYHTSLQPGAYSELCIKPMAVDLVARHNELGEPVYVFAATGRRFEVKANQNLFVKVQDAKGLVETTEVDAAVAEKELANTRLQAHAASRVPGALACEQRYAEEETKPFEVAKAPEAQTITLGADALFSFGKSDRKSISEKGRASLDDLIHRLQNQYGDFKQTEIHVVGHADPIGQPAQNKALSVARANSIREYMIAKGIAPQKVTSEGVGDTQPIFANCGKAPTAENIGCNLPNRRVVVEVRVKPSK